MYLDVQSVPDQIRKAETNVDNVVFTNLHTGHVDGKPTNKTVGSDSVEKKNLPIDQQHVDDAAARKIADEERRRLETEAAERKKQEAEAERARAEELERKNREERKRLEAEAEKARAEEELKRKLEAETRAKRLEAEDSERRKMEALAEQKKRAAEKSADSRVTQHQGSPSHAGEFCLLLAVLFCYLISFFVLSLFSIARVHRAFQSL